MMGVVLIGAILCGAIGAALTLGLGGSFLLALLAYTLCGIIGLMLPPILCALRNHAPIKD